MDWITKFSHFSRYYGRSTTSFCAIHNPDSIRHNNQSRRNMVWVAGVPVVKLWRILATVKFGILIAWILITHYSWRCALADSAVVCQALSSPAGTMPFNCSFIPMRRNCIDEIIRLEIPYGFIYRLYAGI
jgi:hypothetical protein